MIAPLMSVEDFEKLVQASPFGSFFLSLSGKVVDSVRMQGLSRDASVRVNLKLRGGMLRVPRDSLGQWTCHYSGMTHCWATRGTCYRCGDSWIGS